METKVINSFKSEFNMNIENIIIDIKKVFDIDIHNNNPLVGCSN